MFKKRIFTQEYLNATKNQKAMMWLNLFIIMFSYIGTVLIINKHSAEIAEMIADEEV